jgi:hypothetical protein
MVGLDLPNPAVQSAALHIVWKTIRWRFSSHRDFVGAFHGALRADAPFVIAFAISDHTRKGFDLDETVDLLGYSARSNAEDFSR